MKILTIIVSYNFERWMKPCLESLTHSVHPTDVLVIDNGSTDRTVSLLRESYPWVRLIANGENLGFGRANNIGLRLALDEGYDAAFLLNQDAWVGPDALGILAERAERHPAFGILSPVHLNGAGNGLDKGFAQYVGCPRREDLPADKDVVEAPFVNAAFWFIPARTLRTVGGFSPLFYHYGEDKDYINRLHRHGLKVGYAPQAFGCHDREFRPVSREAFFRSEYVYLLSEYANLNRPFGSAFAYSVLACVKKALQSFARLKLKDGCTYLRLTAKLSARTCEAVRIRRETERAGAHFLFSPQITQI